MRLLLDNSQQRFSTIPNIISTVRKFRLPLEHIPGAMICFTHIRFLSGTSTHVRVEPSNGMMTNSGLIKTTNPTLITENYSVWTVKLKKVTTAHLVLVLRERYKNMKSMPVFYLKNVRFNNTH